MKLTQSSSLLMIALSCSSMASDKALYVQMEQNHKIPKEVLYSLALTESGITTNDKVFRPWTYTLNWNGNDYRFNDKKTACKALTTIIDKTKAVDIGETQLHWKYHDKAVESPCDYFDRETALNRTSTVLKSCYETKKNWVLAAGCYHRPAGGKLADDYMKKFATNLETVLGQQW
ncbi:lytic transglycosylase [Vibrio cyclitrophicus 1F175]|uniref:hypothetical protein n=1 Tax=Vibrio TaxID=662 RepID=UPI000381F07F|nr:hypothetical protein [Vibrio cyclitrophicus]OEF67386.1 lytic transglycosylase [Vibrio cyclitrophicus 1F175]